MSNGSRGLKNSNHGGSTAGFVNGLTNGLTNGNGNGKVNGLVNGKNGEEKPRRSLMKSMRGRMGVWTVIGVILILIFGAFAFSMNMFKEEIDWNRITKYTDVDTSPITNPNVNITQFAFHQENGKFYFYLKFEGTFSNANDYKNLAYIFIDSGSSTGYKTGYIDADHLIRIEGFNGAVTGSFMSYNGTGYDWNWTTIGGVIVNEKDNAVEGSIATTFSDDAKILVVAQNKYVQDITPVVGIEKTAVVALQSYSGNTMSIKLIPLYGTVNVNKVSVHTSTNIEVSNPEVLSGIGEISSPKTISVNIKVLTNGSGKAWVSGVSSDAFTTTIWGLGYRKYIGIPQGIIIDGIFDDWKNIPKHSSSSSVADPNINIENYANITYSGNNYFYLSVAGSMLNGNIAPEMAMAKSSGGPGKHGVNYPYDYAEIDFITTNGEHHRLKIWGYNGKVIGIQLDGKNADNIVKVGVGKDGKYGALEIELKGSYQIKSYRVSMTDWSGLHNVATKNSSDDGPVPEFSPLMAVFLVGIAVVLVVVRRRKE